MEIKRAAFVTSMDRYRDYPGIGLAEVAIAGKSNVGKSSMINRLCRNGKLARTSGTPGKTRLLNVYTINDALHLIDLPGYGFARMGREEKLRWVSMMEGYFADSATLRHVLHLVDIRHEPTADDVDMNGFLRAHDIPFTVVATKADKISRGARMKHVAAICRKLLVQPWEVIPFSAEDGTGREQLLELLERVLLGAQEEGMEALDEAPK